MMTKQIDGRLTLCVSSVARRSMFGQAVVNGRLVTEFRADDISHPAGTLVCEPVTESDKAEWIAKYGELYDEHGGILSDTVTRFGVLFWDRGTFSPRV